MFAGSIKQSTYFSVANYVSVTFKVMSFPTVRESLNDSG